MALKPRKVEQACHYLSDVFIPLPVIFALVGFFKVPITKLLSIRLNANVNCKLTPSGFTKT